MARQKRRPFGERLLHPVLAEFALPSRDELFDLIRAPSLADGDQLNVGRVAAGELGGRGNAVEDQLATVCGAAHWRAIGKAMKRRQTMPKQWLIADERLGPTLSPVLRKLPPGSGVLVLHRELP